MRISHNNNNNNKDNKKVKSTRDLYDEKKCKKSLKYAATAMCKQCCCGDADAIKNCTAKPGTLAACPLWFHRPYQRTELKVLDVSSALVQDSEEKLKKELSCQKIKELNNMTDENQQTPETTMIESPATSNEEFVEILSEKKRGRPAVPVNCDKCGAVIAKKSLAHKVKGKFYCDNCFQSLVPQKK